MLGLPMSKPTILTVDDDPLVSAAITRDLTSQYGDDYRIVSATSGAEALDVLARLALRDEPVALIAADQRMPKMTGIELLAQAQTARARREAAAAHRVRRHRRRHQGDQRHRPRLLPAQAVGSAGGAALPGRRRPARRLAAGQPGPHLRRAGRRPPLVRPQPRDQDVPDPQPRAVPLVRRRARRRGRAAARSGRGRHPTTCRWCSFPAATRCARPRPSSSPTRSACTPPPSSRCTTCASSAVDRPVWRPRCTRRRRA